MTLISKLKALLGLDGGRGSERGTTVRVEREPSTGSERAVKESPGPSATEPTRSATDDVPATDDAPAAAGVDADEPAAAPVEDVIDEAETAEEPAVEEPAAGEPAEPAAGGSTEPVDSLPGIGPAYAERLGEAGVETVGDLAAADAADLDDATGIGEGRLAGWIERARDA